MYPISYEADAALDDRNRLTTFFRMLVAIPWQIVAYLYGIAAGISAFIAFFALLFTGRMSDGLFNPIRSALAYGTRATAYFMYMTEDYPPFSLDEGGSPASGQLSREAASRKA